MREFSTIAAFVRHLETLPALIDAEIKRGVVLGATMIRDEVWHEIGHYQLEVGPFPAWPELAKSTKQQRRREGWGEDDPLLRSGSLRASVQFTAIGYAAVIGSNSDVAEWQERGTTKAGKQIIPARSFLGGSAFRLSPLVAEMIGARIAWVVSGNRPRDS